MLNANFNHTQHSAQRQGERKVDCDVIDFVLAMSDGECFQGGGRICQWISDRELDRLKKQGVSGRLIRQARRVSLIMDIRGRIVTVLNFGDCDARRYSPTCH